MSLRNLIVTMVIPLILCCLCELIAASPSDNYDPGFEDLFMTNNKPYENIPIKFHHPLPKWLRGVLVRNGPGQMEMGTRKFLSYLDGYAKLHSWNFPGDGSAFYSSKMIKSKSYISSLEKKEMEACIMFEGPSPPFSAIERMKCMMRNMDNMNVNVFNYRNRTVAINDLWFAYEFELQTLNTIGSLTPPVPKSKFPSFGTIHSMSSAHPVPEYGTSARFEIITALSLIPGMKHRLGVVRITSLEATEMIAEWEIDEIRYMHSFSVTRNYVVLLAAPCRMNSQHLMMTCTVGSGMVWDDDGRTIIYVVEIKTGIVHILFTKSVFVVHHINAFELPNGKIVMDLPTQKSSAGFALFEMSFLLNDTARMDVGSMPTLKRYTLDLPTKSVSITTFESGPKAPCAGELEFPVINENYRHSNYCFIYGLVYNYNRKGFSHFALVKKDVCNNEGDLMYAQPHHYFTEPWFVPKPGGNDEDDGVLMTSAFDGNTKQSYLLMIDPKTMTVSNRANMPTTVPFNFHGRFFDMS
ncbi:beta,beta-carotene 15,15'-dioxygenase-like [Argopecten irradians]|uniref:beta,beta-carotene 15,15'-dioxygenase-like n=1 Tax=Argopecten irradians TaxID=31199 RepID=UPI003720460D